MTEVQALAGDALERRTPTLTFSEAVRARRSIRGFRSEPVPDRLIVDALEEAQLAPSNCNTQPWNMHIVSGAKRDELARALVLANREGRFSPDFSFDMDAFHGRYAERKNQQGKAYYEALAVARDDAEGRATAVELNYNFFNAPHVALLFMPSFGDNVRVASDIGMYGQTFLLALAARGLGGIPQTSLGFFAGTVRRTLGVSEDLKFLFGISFGYPDHSAPGNTMRMSRDPLSDSVTFHR